jgi:hypothetical protein
MARRCMYTYGLHWSVTPLSTIPVKKLMKEKLSSVDRSSIIEIQAVRFSSTGLVN